MSPDTPVIKFVSPTSKSEIAVPLPPQPLRGPLFKLPRELRDQIYRLVLIEPPRWEKTHTPFCKFSPLDLEALAPPPLVAHFYNPWPREAIKQYCPCARRRGLGLVQTCRAIEAEASPIFWSENTFHFPTGGLFLTNVVGDLRRENRKRIAHLAVVRAGYQQDCEWDSPLSDLGREQKHGRPELGPRVSRYDEFWEGISQCTGLRTLEVQVDFALRGKQHMVSLPSRLPHLKALRFGVFRHQRFRAPLRAASAPGPDGLCLVVNYVVCWWTYPVPLGTDEETSRRRAELAYTFYGWAQDGPLPIVNAVLAWSHWKYNGEPFNPDNYPQLPVHPEILVKNPTFRAPLSDGTVVRVKVLGLPMSRWQRAHNLKRRALNEALKAAGLPGLLGARIEEKFQSEEEAARAAASRMLEKEGSGLTEREPVNERAVRLAERRLRDEREQINAEKKDKKARKRGMKEAKETRKAERKRV